jgi:hypothetical protein
MSARSGAATLVREVGLLGLLGLAACSTRAKAAERGGPFLSILRREAPTGVRGRVAPESVSLALGGLPPEELPRLREHLAASTDAAVRRAAPELFDLGELADERAAPDPLREALPDVPALTAAANVLGSPWDAPGISVRLGPACDAAASRCAPLFAPAATPGDALVRRGRALAWALGNAALLRVPANSRGARLRSLREAQSRPSGTLAMVFGATRGALEEAEVDLLRQQAGRALAHLAPDAPQRPFLEALGAARAGWELPIELQPDELLVVPRMSALARLRDFATEVDRAGPFEWVVRPGDPVPIGDRRRPLLWRTR